MIHVRLHPSAVEFGELECCALRKAAAEKDHQPFIASFIARVNETHPPYRVSVLSEIFEKTTRLVFIPRQVHRSFYLHLASKERELIERRGDISLSCGHSVKQHLEALNRICLKMALPQGNS